MALNQTQQFENVIKKSNHILIAFNHDPSVDAVASGLALYLMLKKMDKLVDIAGDKFVLPKSLKFLPKSNKILSRISNLQKFILSVNIDEDKIDTFSYNIEDGKLRIYLTPKAGTFSAEDVSNEQSDYKYDLIITVDTQDLESLGELFQKHTEFFYNTSIVNIDHQPENEHFGQLNVVNLNAVASSEIIYQLAKQLNHDLIDAEVATCLLAGLITKTKSFKTANVTPKTLDVASKLIKAGGDRETIIKSLYRSRTLATMNLWGRVLARLRNGEDKRMVWSILTENDFVESRAEEKDLPDVVDELIAFVPGVKVVGLIYRYKGQVKVVVKALNSYNALQLASQFNPEGTREIATFVIQDTTLAEAEKEVIKALKAKLD